MTAAIEMPTPINFSDNAVKKVKELIEEEGTPDLKLRVFVSGGGCSGMQYGFTLFTTPIINRKQLFNIIFDILVYFFLWLYFFLIFNKF